MNNPRATRERIVALISVALLIVPPTTSLAEVAELQKLDAQANQFYDEERYLEAQALTKKILLLEERRYGIASIEYANRLDSLCAVHIQLNEFEKVNKQEFSNDIHLYLFFST